MELGVGGGGGDVDVDSSDLNVVLMRSHANLFQELRFDLCNFLQSGITPHRDGCGDKVGISSRFGSSSIFAP